MKKPDNNNESTLRKAPRDLDEIQRDQWQSTYDLLRSRTNATEEEASEFATRKVAVLTEIERELAPA